MLSQRQVPRLVAIIAVVLSCLLTACGYRQESFRYRLTVEVETPQGLATGSSVIEVKVSQLSKNAWVTPEARGIRSEVRGEAVAIDLGSGHMLFALLQRAAFLPRAALNLPVLAGDFGYVDTTRALKQIKRVGIVPARAYPMLVTFDDLTNPTTIKMVDANDLSATFGNGLSLRRVTVQMTDDPVTTGLEQRLKWLPAYFDKMLDGQRLRNSQSLANSLSQDAFSQGLLNEG